MSARMRAVAALSVLMAAGLGIALWGARAERRAAPPKPRPQQVSTDGGTPGHPPPEEDPPVVPHPPPGEDRRTTGWRFGDGSERLLALAPASLQSTCGSCHAVPSPTILPRGRWRPVIEDMMRLAVLRRRAPLGREEMEAAAAFYYEHSPTGFLPLPDGPVADPVAWNAASAGRARDADPRITNVAVVDLDRDGVPDILACDAQAQTVVWLRKSAEGWKEEILAILPSAGHTAVVDADGDGDLDVAVAGVGSLIPTDDAAGYATILYNDGPGTWRRSDILRDVPRLADIQPADLDGDGDLDWAVACFGWRMTGFVGWLRNDGTGYELIRLDERPGAIHVPVVDLDGDGRLDIVAILAQENEEIVFYRNGARGFETRKLWSAGNPLYGCSGLEMVDLDGDGDLDCLFSNGDSLDDPTGMSKPYHGVQWLENLGGLEFAWREIGRCYGAYRATAADLDRDGDLDVAVAVMFGDWEAPGARGLLWYENDGSMGFTRHDVDGAPDHMISVAAGDLDGDGDPDLVTGRLLFGVSGRRANGIQVWENRGRR